MPIRLKFLATSKAVFFLLITFAASHNAAANLPDPASDADGYVGNEACAKCHSAIYESYMRSAMAHASGPAGENLIVGEFTHKRSGVHYAIYRDAGKVWLSFDRPGDPQVHDRRELLYYIGQGRRGRTYLFSVDGFVFESPVNWYADRQMWDMAPAYGNATEIPLNLPATTSCLDCHVSGFRPPVNGTQNQYLLPVFLYSGVACERCHGPGAAHVRGAGPIVNPIKLAPRLRDQVCMQCHLEGDVAIERAGKHVYEYKPGGDLSEYARYFVLTRNVLPGLRATSQFEALAQSVCKQKSGDSMSCMSCHDPHQTVPREKRAAFYRAKCLACHGEAFAARHHENQEDCTSCHLPASLSIDVAHTQVTDHRILRRGHQEANPQAPSAALPDLAPFPLPQEGAQDIRDLALAWQSIVESGMSAAQPRAEQRLREALARSPDDPALLSAVAYIVQRQGDDNQASVLYKKALGLDPNLVDASNNLGVLEATKGRVSQAIKLWQAAFARAPGDSKVGMNLAHVFCAAGRVDAATDSVLRVLRFNPDLASAKELLKELRASPPRCSP